MDWMDIKGLAPDPKAPRAQAPGDSGGGFPWEEAPVLPEEPPDEDLLTGLNPAQREACEHVHGPLLILAGPGSGKTRVVTHRIAHLVTTGGMQPGELLALTFTNKAAREMRERVEKLLPGVKGLWISTFHSSCARILRRDIESLEAGYTRDFTIYDTGDRNQLLKELIKKAGLDRTQYRPGAVGAWISTEKNRRGSGGDREVHVDDYDDEGGYEEAQLLRLSKDYEEAMRSSNALDFDDLLLKVLELFETRPGVRDAYAHRFRFVMVDEYQDTNRIQYGLCRHLASVHGNLAVVGDPDQSIYAWRGADVRNILDFERDFGSPRVVVLEQNYRSTGNILAAADAVIRHNNERKAKELWTEAEAGDRIVQLECGDEDEEAREIASQIRSLVQSGRRYADCAIFYRTNFMQRALESALRLAKVPYQVVGGLEFYARREIKDLLSHLRLVVNPADDMAFLRVVNSPTRGVGAKSLEKVVQWSADRRLPLTEACLSEELLVQIRGRGRKGLAEFGQLCQKLAPLVDASAAVALDVVLESIDSDRWMAEMDDGGGVEDRINNVEELRAHAAEFDRLYPKAGLRGFLQEVALVSDVDGLEDATDKAVLMTLHAAKGLEFPFVAIAGVEEELLPHARALAESASEDGGIEEERRLFYVGMTRARERLMLTHATTRRFFGEDRWMRPSRFLDEIPPELIEGGAPEAEEHEVLGDYEPNEDQPAFKVGDRVEHDHFGVGRISQLVGAGINARAVVDFVHAGSKQLLLQYAGLKLRGRE